MGYHLLMFTLIFLFIPKIYPEFQPNRRETAMCKCINRVDSERSTETDHPNMDIEYLPSVLSSCFDFSLADCSLSHTPEKIGGIFLFKPCPVAPSLKLVNISVIAINQHGFPFGELTVNRLVKECFNAAEKTAEDHDFVIHMKDPVEYVCSGLEANFTLSSGIPRWISISADKWNDPIHPIAYQILFKNLIKQVSHTEASPTSISLIAEFLVKGVLGNDDVHVYRLMSEQRQISFGFDNAVNFSNSKHSSDPPQLNRAYVEFQARLCKDSQIFDTKFSSINDFIGDKCSEKMVSKFVPYESLTVCLHFSWEGPFVASMKKRSFYFSIQKKNVSTCRNFSVLKAAVAVLRRNSDGFIGTAGAWSHVSRSNPEWQHCNKGSSSERPKIYNEVLLEKREIYCFQSGLFISGEMLCSRWEYDQEARTDLQMQFKLIYDEQGVGSSVSKYTTYPSEMWNMHPNQITYTIRKLLIMKDQTNSLEKPEGHRNQLLRRSRRQTKLRKTAMCSCTDPRRPADSLPTVAGAKDDIPQLPGDLSNCFSFRMIHCPSSHTPESLGAVFMQKKCPGKSNLETIDIAFVAINELGYAYGKLTTNTRIRECFASSASRATGITGDEINVLHVNPTLNDMYPRHEECDSLNEPDSTKFPGKKPAWLSIDAKLKVTNGLPSAIQVLFMDKIYQSDEKLRPESLQIVAEFSVREGTGTPKTYRLRTKQWKLAFNDTVVNVAKSTKSDSEIKLKETYMSSSTECKSLSTVTTGAPTAAEINATRMRQFCRCFESDDLKPKPDPVPSFISPCLSTYASIKTNSTALYFHIGRATGGGKSCDNSPISQIVITMVGQDSSLSPKLMGKWNFDPAYFQSGNCYPSGGGYQSGRTISEKFSEADCDDSQKDKKMFYYYPELEKAGEIVCVKWELTDIPNGLTELQIGYKLQYDNGGLYWYHSKHPEMFELWKDNTGASLTKLSNVLNPRSSLLITEKFTTLSKACLTSPFQPTSVMCDCSDKRHGGLEYTPKTKVIPLSKYSGVDASCFDFFMTSCTTDGITNDTIGAVLIIYPQSVRSSCSGKVFVEDASFMALNGNGYPFGEPEYSSYLRSCLSPDVMMKYRVKGWYSSNPYPETSNERYCNSRKHGGSDYSASDFQYGSTGSVFPGWVQVNISVSIQTLRTPLAVQIPLKRPAQTPTATKIQFVVEMVISKDGSNRKVVALRTPVYKVAYRSLGGAQVFDGQKLTLSTGGTSSNGDIVPSPEYYEIKFSDAKCSKKGPTVHAVAESTAGAYQSCVCFDIMENSTRLDPLEKHAVNDLLNECVHYAWKTHDPPLGLSAEEVNGTSRRIFLTIWTHTKSQKAICDSKTYQVVAIFLTPYRRDHGPTYAGKIDGMWERATKSISGHAALGDQCPQNGTLDGYTGKLRRPPGDFAITCPKEGKMFQFYYPLMNQPDNANAFCASWKPPDSAPTRYEFQFSAEYIVQEVSTRKTFSVPYKTPIVEYCYNSADPTNQNRGTHGIRFPRDESTFSVANPVNCETDVCPS